MPLLLVRRGLAGQYIVVFLKEKQRFVQHNTGITVTGVLETGSQVDEETGFVSQLRLRDAEFHMSGE